MQRDRIVAPLRYRGQHIPIDHPFRDAPFDADRIELMSSAFEDVSQQLGLGRREDAIRDIVARAILECAQRGIRDPIEMRKCARDVLRFRGRVDAILLRCDGHLAKDASISSRDRTKSAVRR